MISAYNRELAKKATYSAPTPADRNAAASFLLDFLCIPHGMRENCSVFPVALGGTGALNLGTAFMQVQGKARLGFQKLGWAGYTSIADYFGMPTKEVSLCLEYGLGQRDLIWLQQCHNGTGLNLPEDAPLKNGTPSWVCFDLPYHGLGFLSLSHAKARVKAIKPIVRAVDAGANVIIAFSPTKVFSTFAQRPCGFVVVICQRQKDTPQVKDTMAVLSRGMGCGFKDIASMALVKLMAEKSGQEQLLRDARNNFDFLKKQTKWIQDVVAGSRLEQYFDEDYGGLFRVFDMKSGAKQRLLQDHGINVVELTPDGKKVRLNIAYIPDGDMGVQVLEYLEQEV